MRVRPRRPKYGNEKTAGSASKRESHRLAELRLLEKAGKISDLRTQVRYELIPAQYELGKCIERAVTYTADFVYEDLGVGIPNLTVVEDAKGVRTQQYVIRRKLMLWLHGIRIREV